MDFGVGWFLRDPVVWRRLRQLYVATRTDLDGTLTTLGPLPIPPQQPGNGTMWAKVFRSVYRWFQVQLATLRPVRDDEDRWTSYGLSYLALRRCVLRAKQGEFSYVYSACKNAHKKSLKREMPRLHLPLDEKLVGEGDGQAEVDLRLDLEDALSKLEGANAEVCRHYLIEGLTFAEIGQRLGLHESTVQRRYEKSLPTIRSVLRHYMPESGGC